MSDQDQQPESPTPSGDAPKEQPKSGLDAVVSSIADIVSKADQAAGIESPAAQAQGAAGESEAKKGRRKRKRKPRSPAEAGSGDSLAAEVDALTQEVLPQASGRGRGRGGKKKAGRGGKKGSAMSHARDAVQALSAMTRHVLDSQEVHFLARPRFMELSVKVPLDARMDGARAAARLVDLVLKRVGEVRENASALSDGAVYCYFSESAEAEGCRPAEPREVFDGYSSTGRPKFTDFVTMAIERKTPGIDNLVSGADITLCHVSQGRVLRSAQLAEFGKASPVFKVLGQVDAGLFAVRGQDTKAAFSFQVLRGQDLEGRPMLRLHPVGKCNVMSLADHSVPQILQRFQGDLDEASLRLKGRLAKGEEVDEEEFILPLMQDLAKRLADRARHAARRTEHANQRAEKGNRPTAKAYDEAQQVSDDDLLFDAEKGSFVVLGSHSRVHVFSPEAKHITSVTMNRGSVQARIKSNRWRHTEAPERGEFRMQLRQLVKSRREDQGGKSRPSKRGRSAQPAAPAADGLQSKIASMLGGLGGDAPAAAEPPSEAPPARELAQAENRAADAPQDPSPEVPSPEAQSPEAQSPKAPAPEASAPPPAEGDAPTPGGDSAKDS